MRLIEFTGARRIPLIGRQDLLQEAERRIGRGGIHLLFVEGGGGIGKTALLEAILERSQWGSRAEAMSGCCVAQEVVDLYHVDVHTAEGLMRRIMEVLGKWFFQETQRVLSALDRARVSGDMDSASQYESVLQTTFFTEFAALTEEGVLLAFDTLEVLEYEHDPFGEELGEEVPVFSVGKWLFQSFFPALQGNVVVLLAGRSADLLPRLHAIQQENGRVMIRHIQLEALNQEETREYLKAVAQAEGRRGDGDAAARLWTYSDERGDVIHFLTEGRPILLALVADMIAQDWALPPAFERTLEELEGPGLEQWRPGVERALVVHIQSNPTPIGNTLCALAWLRKGATPELLAQLLDLKNADGEWDRYTATGYLDQATQLALVKVRPGDRRVFLHDEMVALLESYVLQECDEEERERVYTIIQAYYRHLTRQLEQRVAKLSPVLAVIQSRLRQAFVEEMHYRLYFNPPMGLAMYFWLAEEALGGRDVEMDMLVRTEFLRTLAMLFASDCFLGMVPREAELDVAVRWGMRALFLKGDPEAALNILERVRKRWGRQARKLELSWAHLQLYRALAKIRRAAGDDWQDAREVLASVEEMADRILAFPPENPVVRARRWRARIIKSLALNYLGYLDRQQGRYHQAVRHYQGSAMLQRRLGMNALVSTLTNLSYALAQMGEFHRARLLGEEAERLARRGGQNHLLAQTLNVRAFVEAFDDHHRAALRYADRALEIGTQLPSERMRGLSHLARARAYRYLWASLCEEDRKREAGLFEEAVKEANQAVSLLRGAPADRVGALLERGCIYRELARLHHSEGRGEEAQEIADRSRQDLERVAVLAAALGLRRQQSLAWTDLGWLCYYLGRVDEVQEALQQAYQPFPAEYLFPERGPLPPMAQEKKRDEASLPCWSALGKAEMLKAYLALDQALGAPGEGQEQQLRTAVRHITLSLAYNELIADSYFELTRAEEGLHRRIVQDGLSIKAMHQYARQVAEEQELRQPTRFQTFLSRMFGPTDLWV
jgi:tetratricopeptide (TPR) repeat protein